ncbi:hypothetical protein B0H13DRAFT_1872268 [Mycena leptocephala]|nr:hypothetical protein B0H13DRAFT_1872268 [Mycena leptocephala]
MPGTLPSTTGCHDKRFIVIGTCFHQLASTWISEADSGQLPAEAGMVIEQCAHSQPPVWNTGTTGLESFQVLVQLAWILSRWSLAIQCGDISLLNTCAGTVAMLGYVAVRLT